jgi:hypothetical protein
MTDAEAIRERIIRWAFAVHTGDLEPFSPTMIQTS